jgi:hypothetical protein
MSNSENWVSHTPESKLKAELDEDEFASAADIGYIPPSPPNAFEKFFLPVGISQDSTSSFAEAARRIQKNNNSDNRRLISPYSITSEARTEDYASAEEEHSNASEIDDLSLEESTKSVLFNDVLGSPTILEETPEKTHEMSSTTPETMAEPTPTPVETVPEPTSEESTPEFDVVDHVYEGAKSVWSFGKGIIVFKPFMGVAEGVATKVLSITTGVSSLEDADKGIKCALSGVDKEFIDPAILQLWSLLEPIIGKGDDVLKTVMGFVSKDTPLLEAEEETVAAEETIPEPKLASKEESEEAIAPETSTPAVIA